MLSTSGQSLKIGLLDHMGYGNLGDAAIQEVVIANIRKRLPNARLVAFSLIPDDTVKRHGIPCYPILRWHPTSERTANPPTGGMAVRSKLKATLKRSPFVYSWAKPILELVREVAFWARSYRTLRALNLLVISGGGQLGELWRGPWALPYTIFKFCVLAKLARKKLYFLDVGAGPLKHPVSRFFIKWAVRLADYRSFRDEDSQALINSLGVKAKTLVYPDPVYALEVRNHLKRPSRRASVQVVGLNPFGFCDPRVWPRKNRVVYQTYLEKITQFSSWLLESGYSLRVFTTDTSVDQYAINDLKARLSSRLSPDLIRQIFPRTRVSVSEVLNEMAEFDFVVTSKFHGIIFSHLLGKPVISLSYHRKIDVAMAAVGQDRFSADAEQFEVDWLIRAFQSLTRESIAIKSHFTNAVAARSSALSEQFDSLFLHPKSLSWTEARPLLPAPQEQGRGKSSTSHHLAEQ